MTFNTKIFGLLTTVALLASCTPAPKAAVGVSDYDAIFSTRPQTATHTLVMIKLAQPPLVTTLKVVDGKKVFDADRAKAIEAEQTKTIEALGDISSEIKVLYRYRLIINGLTVVAPIELVDRIGKAANVVQVETAKNLGRPVLKTTAAQAMANATAAVSFERNSVKFIGGDEAHAAGFRGQGMKVGIIDTGIDYTHAMFGGAGTEEAYKAIDPSKPNPQFPTPKVAGGIDLVGTKFDSGSADFMNRIPIPDANPLDEAGHGSHVAGTVAGHGDGVNTYDGVAPDALLYAIKVFGAKGSSSDSTVVAALEYALDPNGDGDISDQLDVVNLSLGGGYGEPHILYTEAVHNLTAAGTVVVASGGNSGDVSYIVGAPSSSDDAISVAASLDDGDLNWKFAMVKFSTPTESEIYEQAIEGTVGKSVKDIGDVTGPLVYVGLADKDFADDVKAKVAGKVALIDRGIVTFQEKVQRAFDAGAIGVVVANNQPGAPISMGGGTGPNHDEPFAIPAIMVEQELGAKLKAGVAAGETTIAFKTEKKSEKPELIDTIAEFSSRGPRSQDALIKPEISAPGSNTISAAMGKGNKGVPLSGTSMAGPHVAGVMALLKQTHPTFSVAQLKSIVMNTTKTLVNEKKEVYPISRQGAGRVQIMKAIAAPIVALPSSLSLGEQSVESRKVLLKTVQLTNVSAKNLELAVSFEGPRALRMTSAASVKIEAAKDFALDLQFAIDAANLPAGTNELGGWIFLKDGANEVARIPVLAVANKISQVGVESLLVHSTSAADSQGAWVEALLKNAGINAGDVYLFNYLGADERKVDSQQDAYRSHACDLAAGGYRVIERDGVKLLQVAVKLYEPMTTWDNCEVSVLIDSDGDGVADQELVGAKQDHLAPLTAKTYASILLDSPTAMASRKAFELKVQAGDDKVKEDYSAAILSVGQMAAFEHSTISIVEAPLTLLKLRPSGDLAVRIATSYQEASAIEADDFLGENGGKENWLSINVRDQGAGYVMMPEKTTVTPGQSKSVSFTKGAGPEALWAIYPNNTAITGGLGADSQSTLPTSKYTESVQ